MQGSRVIDGLMARLSAIPREAKDYTYTAREAQKKFGADAQTLAALREAGLAQQTEAGAVAYAHHDLHYLGLRLGSARSLVRGLELWRDALVELASASSTPISITYHPHLSSPSEPLTGCVLLPEDRYQRVQLWQGQPAARFTTKQRSTWPRLPAAVRPVLDEIAALDLCLLPHRLRNNVREARRLGMIECGTAATVVADECKALGYAARVVRGLLVSFPFSSSHTWAEVNLDGTWTAADPVVLAMLWQFAALDRAEWPVDRSLGPALVRIATRGSASLVSTAGDETVAATFMTRRESAAADSARRGG